MAKTASFTKRALITKANSTMVVTTGIAAFIVIFCLVASKTLASQAAYQNRVISSKKHALATLKSDISAVDTLKSSYKSFVETSNNVLGGNPVGTGDQDGDNAKIILDALPSTYDFPAVAASMDKLIASQGLVVLGISGTDEAASQASATDSETVQPVPMPFQIHVSGTYDSIKGLLSIFERSIRPIQVQKVQLTGDKGGVVNATIDAQTFYQPAKTLKIKTQVVK